MFIALCVALALFLKQTATTTDPPVRAPDVIGPSQNSHSPGARTDVDGKFRIEHIAPGRKFAVSGIIDLNTMEFIDVRGLSVESGKARDLGDLKPSTMP
jgi:hypothetical protein